MANLGVGFELVVNTDSWGGGRDRRGVSADESSASGSTTAIGFYGDFAMTNAIYIQRDDTERSAEFLDSEANTRA